MQRVMVIGCSGAGKSTLTRQLAKEWDLPVIHLDRAYWQPYWVETPKEEWRAKVGELVLAERWIMDGNYSGSMDIRLPHTDLIIWLDFSRWLCLWRVFKRTLRFWGRVRPDMTDGCAERFDFPFFHYVFFFPEIHRPRLLKRLADYPDSQILRFSSPRQLNQWQTEGYKLKN